jgi:hypothetical protein
MRFDRGGHGLDVCARRTSGFWLFGRSVRLCAELFQGDPALGLDPVGLAYFAIYYAVFRFAIVSST